MTDLPEFDFILRVREHHFHQYPIKQIKMDGFDGQISKIRYMVQDTASIQSFTHISHNMNRGVDRPLYYV